MVKLWNKPVFIAAALFLASCWVAALLRLLGVLEISTTWGWGFATSNAVLFVWALCGWWVMHKKYLLGFAGLCVAGFGMGLSWGGDSHGSASAVFGITCMASIFVLGLWLVRIVLSVGLPIFGVARAVVDEAVRMKIVLVFIVGLFVLVPVLPFMLDPNELLRYRIQFFLRWTLSISTWFLSLMTLFLACGTICNEVDRRQIFLTLTKPIGRGQYLVGKWLGIAMLNLLLLSVAGAGVYAFTGVFKQQGARDESDRRAVDTQVLVAREVVHAQPPSTMDMTGLFNKRLEQLRAENPGRYGQGKLDLKARRLIEQSITLNWHTIAPRASQRYMFTGLGRAKEYSKWIQLRLKPVMSRPPPDEYVRLALRLNGRPYPLDARSQRHLPIVVADRHYHIINLPVEAIDQAGQLDVRITNVDLDNPRATFSSSVAIAPGQGLEVLYQVDHFGPNLIRTLGLIWIRLTFLAMLGLTAGTFLGFPVACMLCLLVCFTAVANTFLLESMRYYVSFGANDLSWWDQAVWVPRRFFNLITEGDLWGAIKILIRLIGNGFVLLIPSFSDYNPIPSIADGRLVDITMLGRGVVRVGFIWTGLCALIGWLVFRGRELARVTV